MKVKKLTLIFSVSLLIALFLIYFLYLFNYKYYGKIFRYIEINSGEIYTRQGFFGEYTIDNKALFFKQLYDQSTVGQSENIKLSDEKKKIFVLLSTKNSHADLLETKEGLILRSVPYYINIDSSDRSNNCSFLNGTIFQKDKRINSVKTYIRESDFLKLENYLIEMEDLLSKNNYIQYQSINENHIDVPNSASLVATVRLKPLTATKSKIIQYRHP